jgi:hypothetical protein
MERLAFDVELERREVVRATRTVLFRESRHLPLLSGILLVFFPLLYIASTGLLILIAGRGHIVWQILLLPLAFAFMALWLRSTALGQFRNDPRSTQTIHYSVDDEGIEQVAETWRATHLWPAILDVEETKLDILLFVAPKRAMLVPKRCLSPDQAAAFLAMVAAHPRPSPQRQTYLARFGWFLLWMILFAIGIAAWILLKNG